MLRKPFSDWFGGKWPKPINKRLLNRNDSNLKLEPKNRRQMQEKIHDGGIQSTFDCFSRFKYYCYQHIIFKSKMNI